MKIPIYFRYIPIYLIIIIIICLLAAGCIVSVNIPPKIAGMEVQNSNLYPKQSTEIKCNASDPEGGPLTFNWSSTDGSFSGSGPVVSWTAPNKYGDFHIIVVVKDEKVTFLNSTCPDSLEATSPDPSCSVSGSTG